MRLPKAFRFTSTEVQVERQGDAVLLKPMPAVNFRTFTEIARHLADKFPGPGDFPSPPTRPVKHERPIPVF